MENKENGVDFITGQRTCTVSFTEQKWINKMKKLYEQHKEDFDYFVENKDGSVTARIPKKWFKISYPRQVSDEQREAARIRFTNMQKEKQ